MRGLRRKVQLTLEFLQTAENGIYELITLPREGASSNGDVRDSSTEGKRGQGASAIFVARNRFAVLDKTAQVSCDSVDVFWRLCN